MKRTRILDALQSQNPVSELLVKGWVRTKRESKGFAFLEMNDGSCLSNIQVIVDNDVASLEDLKDVNTGASLVVHGELVESPGKGQKWEVRATKVEIVGEADAESYPLQKKRHSDEFLRAIAHLRPRTNKYGALFRIRSEAAYAVHDYFRSIGFYHLHTPILTGSDCEGAGEMFRVTAQEPEQFCAKENPWEEDFFGREANLTVSGQLEAELFAHALYGVYTFGPTFRAENSNTPRHAAEFWMIEPEAAFYTLEDNMDLAEGLTKAMTRHVMENCSEDLGLFTKWVDKELGKDLEIIAEKPFERISYTEAIEILSKSGKKFEYPVHWGADLQTEHERFLAEEHFKKPVFVYDYPKEIKAFYMRLNDDGKTVGAMDLLVPRVGELVGGSAREERMDVLVPRMDEMNLDKSCYWWYLDIRRYGTTPHAGFGLGFERFLMMATGVTNIRDVIPFPRTPRHLEF